MKYNLKNNLWFTVCTAINIVAARIFIVKTFGANGTPGDALIAGVLTMVSLGGFSILAAEAEVYGKKEAK